MLKVLACYRQMLAEAGAILAEPGDTEDFATAEELRELVVEPQNDDDLPAELCTQQFADLDHCGRSTVLAMIRRGTIPTRPVTPRRGDFWAVIDPPEPEYQSRPLAGRL